mgnify:CR=1 FL=1
MPVFTRRLPAEADAPVDGELRLPFDARVKSRARWSVARGVLAGRDVGLDLPRGAVLRDGDRVGTEDGTATLRVAAATEQLLHVRARDAVSLARLAYHLGNRHVPVQVGEDASGGWLRLQLDHVLEHMVHGLGGAVEVVSAPFEPESGAYAGGHVHHGHADADPTQGGRAPDGRHAPRIHDFTEPGPT